MSRPVRPILVSIAALAMTLAASSMAGAQTSAKRAITFKDLISIHRVGDPQISPDARWVAYTVATPDIDANRNASNVWIVSMAGGDARQLTRSGKDQRPRWSPDGKTLVFLSSRDGASQVYSIPLEGGEPTRITSISTGADNELWSPDGKWIAFISSVYPDCKDEACNSQRDAEHAKSKVKAHVYDKLLYRHWTSWSDGKRSHLFILPVTGGAPRDLTPGADYDVPPFNLGEPEAISFSPDSREICFTANTDKDEALSTNGDLFTVPANGSAAPQRITSNPANDWGGMYSPDGKWIAYRAQMRPGYESDRWRLMLYGRRQPGAKPIDLTEDFDSNVESVAWSADSSKLYFETEEKAELPIYSIATTPGSKPNALLADTFNADLDVSHDGRLLVFTRTSLAMPAEIFVANSDGTGTRQLTHQNADLLAQLDLPVPEPFWFEGAGGTQVEGLMLPPPHFDASKKYPMLLLIHGGPQGEWDDSWGYRWNEQLMASPGYVVVAINPRGSFGYGHKFAEEISRDWGGKVYDDLMKGVDAAIAKYPFIDKARLAAAGGSYGGYMVDWVGSPGTELEFAL